MFTLRPDTLSPNGSVMINNQSVWDAVHRDLEPHRDITTSLGLRTTSISLKSFPDLHRRNSVRVHPYAHPQHIKVLNTLYTYDMDVGCSSRGFGASTMTLQHHLGSALPQFSKNASLTCTGTIVWCTHMPIHSISRC
jgi:hypothetical protein